MVFGMNWNEGFFESGPPENNQTPKRKKKHGSIFEMYSECKWKCGEDKISIQRKLLFF